MKKSGISDVLRSKKTVFTSKDLSLIWGVSDMNLVKSRANYFVRTNKLYSIRRGLYAKDQNYDKFELATRIYTPSYVSFETVLGRAGITFQYYSQIFIASYLTREIVCDKQKYSFKKIKDVILTNNLGVENKDNYAIATKERALLDTIYVKKYYYFDNLSPLNWDEIFRILPIYQNKRMEKKVKEIYEDFKKNE